MPVVLTIKPPNFPDIRKLTKAHKQAVEEAFDISAAKAQIAFQKTVETWDKKPRFRIRKSGVSRKIEVNSVLWFWIDRGTRMHNITAVKKPYLSFRLGYVRKTIPGIADSFRGGYDTGQFVTPDSVTHPGITARRFTETITNSELPRLIRDVEKKIAQVQGKIF